MFSCSLSLHRWFRGEGDVVSADKPDPLAGIYTITCAFQGRGSKCLGMRLQLQV